MTRLSLAYALGALLAGPALGADTQDRVAYSRAAIQQFAGMLQGELKAAMQAGGPTNATAVCEDKAPAIAARILAETGWEVARTSLRTRQPANAPDARELGALVRCEERKTAGEDPKALDFAEVVEVDGKPSFRYMKAIPTQVVGLTCHGGKLSPAVAERLDRLYPGGQARGFAEGDIRGAFSIVHSM